MKLATISRKNSIPTARDPRKESTLKALSAAPLRSDRADPLWAANATTRRLLMRHYCRPQVALRFIKVP